MMVKPPFILLCKPLDFARHNIHLQVSVEVMFLMYLGGMTMFLSTLLWNRCIMSILLCLVQPQSWIPYVQMGFRICLYKRVSYLGTVLSVSMRQKLEF